MIPGKSRKNIDRRKTIDVSGTKSIGDQAKGTVILYNKDTSSSRMIKKVPYCCLAPFLYFDDDVSVASATVNLVNGNSTFGKSTGAITARAIGVQSNLSENSEFSFKEFSDILARNEKQLSGGTSRDVTVVTRADQDALVKSVSIDLLESSKRTWISNF